MAEVNRKTNMIQKKVIGRINSKRQDKREGLSINLIVEIIAKINQQMPAMY